MSSSVAATDETDELMWDAPARAARNGDDDRPDIKASKFTYAIGDARAIFGERALALQRGSKTTNTVVKQRCRVDGIETPLWEDVLQSTTAVPLSSAIYSLFDVTSYPHQYIMCAPGNGRAVAQVMHEDLFSFPEVPPFSGEYCFRNGVLDIRAMDFTPYEEYICGADACAHKHIPIEFDSRWLADDIVLPTPAIDAIFETQEWNAAEQQLLLAMLGRMAYPVGLFDKWQTALFLTGVGGSGKTTLTNACAHSMYETCQIGYISNTIEKNFPFESLTKVNMVIAADIDESLMTNLSQTDLHKIINGEEVEINVKHGGRTTLQWHAPLCLVANVVPNWQDDQGQMSRRIVYFDFSKKPPRADTSLEEMIKDPMQKTMLLLKLCKTYRSMAAQYCSQTMDNIIKQRYPRLAYVSRNVQLENAPLYHFIDECLMSCPMQFVPMRSLQDIKMRFCKAYDYDPRSIQFRKEFQNICAARSMKYYSATDITKSDAYRNASSGATSRMPKTAFLDNASITLIASLMADAS